MPLIEITQGYDMVYDWFNFLRKDGIETVAYVVMPNHLHNILYFPDENFNLNKIIGNAKRFMAYEIVNRLEQNQDVGILQLLENAVTSRERKKGQLHKVFKDSFDAKPIYTEKFLLQKLNYIHHNPVSGKWNLAKDFISYEHSSASFYEENIIRHFAPKHFRDI